MAIRDERQLRRQFCDVGRQLYERGFVVACDGSLSARLGTNSYLFTPSRSCLGTMEPDDMVLTDAGGASTRDDREPSADWRLHLTCYRERPDVRFVLHAHPPWCLAASAAGLSLARPVLPDIVLHIGTIPTARYAPPASQKAADSIRGLVCSHDAILLDRHGAITVDATIEGAVQKLEHMELQARIITTVEPLGVLRILPREELQRLREARGELSLNPQAVLPDPSWEGTEHHTTQAAGGEEEETTQ
jgi:L-fuculose-phosphate aldolase